MSQELKDHEREMFYAVSHDDVKSVQRLLCDGVSPNIVGIDGLGLINSAAADGHLGVLAVLLDAGADPSLVECPPETETPLGAAAHRGNVACLRALLAMGEDPNRRDLWGFSPLMVAAMAGHTECVDALLSGGAQADEEDALKVSMLLSEEVTKGTAEELLSIFTDPQDGGGTSVWQECQADSPYIYIDLAPDKSSSSWPVVEMDCVPEPIPVEYRTTRLLLRRIPAGSFTMGSPSAELGHSRTETMHKVHLTRSFYIGVYEVTQTQWCLVMGEPRRSHFDAEEPDSSYGDLDGQRPADTVAYDDIRGRRRGAAWPRTREVDLRSFMGTLRCRTGLPFDLPTEAEWEYACRAGTTSALNNGKEVTAIDAHCIALDAVGWFRYNASKAVWSPPHAIQTGTQPVGMKEPNRWGLYDMHGNVAEWCRDWYAISLGESPHVDPRGPARGKGDSLRVVRGGGWDAAAKDCRSARRRMAQPFMRFFANIGFRVSCPAALE
jgi:formylglycine-generating enzyme required for sulfatase activity